MPRCSPDANVRNTSPWAVCCLSQRDRAKVDRSDEVGFSRSARWLSLLAALAALAAVACGGRLGDTSADAASDAPVDVTAPDASTRDATTDAPSDAHDGGPGDAGAADASADAPAESDDAGCHPCLVGDGKCVSGALSSCIDVGGGCTAFSVPIACGANALCQERLYRAWCGCQPGAVDDGSGAGCVQVIGAPRLIAPLSTATVTTRNPTLRWELAPGTDGVQIDLRWVSDPAAPTRRRR